MQKFFGIDFDTTNMSQEEFDKKLKEARDLYFYLSTQSKLRKMANRRHHSSETQSSPR